MKILRIRRGFTTNSSASSEWVPPPPGSESAGPGSGAVNHPASPSSLFASNGVIVGGIVGLLIVLFFLERWIKKLWKNFRARKDE